MVHPIRLFILLSDKVILFLTDGEPGDKAEDILKTIREENAKLNNKVVILSYGIGEGEPRGFFYWDFFLTACTGLHALCTMLAKFPSPNNLH